MYVIHIDNSREEPKSWTGEDQMHYNQRSDNLPYFSSLLCCTLVEPCGDTEAYLQTGHVCSGQGFALVSILPTAQQIEGAWLLGRPTLLCCYQRCINEQKDLHYIQYCFISIQIDTNSWGIPPKVQTLGYKGNKLLMSNRSDWAQGERTENNRIYEHYYTRININLHHWKDICCYYWPVMTWNLPGFCRHWSGGREGRDVLIVILLLVHLVQFLHQYLNLKQNC